MSDLENLSNLEHLDELSKNAIEKMESMEAIEMPSDVQPVEKPDLEVVKYDKNISFRGGNCYCSCDLTCTRA